MIRGEGELRRLIPRLQTSLEEPLIDVNASTIENDSPKQGEDSALNSQRVAAWKAETSPSCLAICRGTLA